MRFIRKVLRITCKAVRLGVLLTLDRCFGPAGAAYVLANLQVVGEQIKAFFRDLF